ncbi:AzlD domain-containing protein [Marinomonas posidonica]|uniref:Branched-chain amino acid transport n=1 Tax=Marinomonas posidonica (strain CECT 7376 / NCIMB 14433 / IVIA-Po-181) TaxID=491952 RepID=F6CRR3_MARPP|nr:AzlD domain-containing protein [Marinomonas posidonica]AEF54916.1 branched-chain amino acid transport [Marinomonas posidonica IVIA-Po-181]
MSVTQSLVIILGMFVVTFGVRFVLLARAHKVTMPDYVERALKYMPVAVLTAIITPMVLMPSGEMDVSLDNPWLLGALAAFAVGIYRQHQLLTIVIGVLVFFVARYAL